MTSSPPGHWRYDDHDTARRLAETSKSALLPMAEQVPARSAFGRDRARVLHSSSFRRLAGKTQVVAPDSDEVPRTRLTHSLEVAQIAREIGGQLGCDPDLVDLAGLAHDIGHPPFGHNGETALDRVGGPAGGFEANAQNLRLLATLEPKVMGEDGEPAGLNLCRASLDAVIKYPWTRPDRGGKFGVYATEAAVFGWLRPTGDTRRCLEAQVMDWADDVAYSVHDVEDGVLAGRIELDRLSGAEERHQVAALAASLSDDPVADLAGALDDLLALPVVAQASGYRPGLAGDALLKRMTSELTGRLATGAVAGTVAVAGPGPHGRYAADLVVPAVLRAEVALLKAIATRYVMEQPARLRVQQREQELLTELVGLICDRGAEALDPGHAQSYRQTGDDAGRLRVVLDQVSLLTDAQAIAWHARLTGSRGVSVHPW